ncbi:DegV family protein [Corticicoccus populi]|uniref:DegV family protein n=1 Tax=Corticicoccus populi TaxID=1812821 RepID=A0ABW5WYA3_9STAP
MKKFAIVTDSAAGLSESFIKEHDIKVLPMTVIIDGTPYRDGVDIKTEEIYELLKESGEGAKTSQPSQGEFIDVYKDIEADENYDGVLAVHASSELTGTYQNSLSASKEINKPAVVIDSRLGSYPMRQMIVSAVESRNNGETIETVEKNINEISENGQLFLLPHSFSQMRKSGRVSASQTMLATLLQVQIKLKFDDGKIVIGEKVRTKKKMATSVLKSLEAHVKNDAVKTLSIVYAGKENLINEWKTKIEEHIPHLKLECEPLVPVAGVHVGYGTIGFGFIKGK